MRISRHDLRCRYSNSLVIDAGSHFTLRACSQANENLSLQQSFTLPTELLHTSMFLQKMWDMVDHTVNVWCYVSFTISLQLSTKGCEKSYPSSNLIKKQNINSCIIQIQENR